MTIWSLPWKGLMDHEQILTRKFHFGGQRIEGQNFCGTQNFFTSASRLAFVLRGTPLNPQIFPREIWISLWVNDFSLPWRAMKSKERVDDNEDDHGLGLWAWLWKKSGEGYQRLIHGTSNHFVKKGVNALGTFNGVFTVFWSVWL